MKTKTIIASKGKRKLCFNIGLIELNLSTTTDFAFHLQILSTGVKEF